MAAITGPDYGTMGLVSGIGNLAQGINQGLITYQNQQNIKYNQKMEEALTGMQRNDDGSFTPTPAKQQAMQLQAATQKQQMDEMDATTPRSDAARSFAKQSYKLAYPDATDDQIDGLIPNTMSASQIKELGPIFAKPSIQGGFSAQNTNTKTLSAEDIAAQKAAAAAGKKADAGFKQLDQDLDPNRARTGNFGQAAAKVMSAQRVQALFNQYPDGNIPSTQTHELATSVAALINNGSARSQEQINAMVPQSLQGKWEDIASWYTNQPQGREQQAFIKSLQDTTNREGDLAKDQVKQIEVSRLPVHQTEFQADPARYRGILQAHGFQPEEIGPHGEYVPPQGLITGGQNQSSGAAQDPKITQYAQQNGLDYAHAAQILKARGYNGQQ